MTLENFEKDNDDFGESDTTTDSSSKSLLMIKLLLAIWPGIGPLLGQVQNRIQGIPKCCCLHEFTVPGLIS